VKKVDNPPAVPECRPIEDFWGILKGKVYESNWQAKDVKQLQTRIKLCLKKIDPKKLILFGSTCLRLGRIQRANHVKIYKQLNVLFKHVFDLFPVFKRRELCLFKGCDKF
jgi:hypothetical protein